MVPSKSRKSVHAMSLKIKNRGIALFNAMPLFYEGKLPIGPYQSTKTITQVRWL